MNKTVRNRCKNCGQMIEYLTHSTDPNGYPEPLGYPYWFHSASGSRKCTLTTVAEPKE